MQNQNKSSNTDEKRTKLSNALKQNLLRRKVGKKKSAKAKRTND